MAETSRRYRCVRDEDSYRTYAMSVITSRAMTRQSRERRIKSQVQREHPYTMYHDP